MTGHRAACGSLADVSGAPTVAESGTTFSFGQFQLLADRRLLLAGGERVRLGGRALDILLVLVENHGRLVTKDELTARVWPNTVVHENTLKVHVSALRRAFGGAGREYLQTDPGRGYRFVAPIDAVSRVSPGEQPAQRGIARLPTSLTRLIGREEALADLMALTARYRLTTITGPGGIGKSRMALAVAAELASEQAKAAFVELAPVQDPDLVSTAIAGALGLEIHTAVLEKIIAFLRDRRILLVLDNCEHVAEAVANVAEAVLKAAPGTRILATGREPLHIEGERIYRLTALAFPQPSRAISALQALCFPAVELFVERAGAARCGYTLSDEDAPAVVEVCRQLDGLPLAIELAAARGDMFEPRELAARLRDSFLALTSIRRSALPHQRTLRATLDWSYALLTQAEQAMLRKLATFAGGFTLEAAEALAGDGLSPAEETVDLVASLVAKSLVTPGIGEAISRYHLLETTRLYATEKLRESGEYGRFSRRHAEYFCHFLERAEEAWETTSVAEWLTTQRPEVDNIRAALAWAFGQQGDVSLGFALASASVHLWVELSLLGECQNWIDRAVTSIANGSSNERQRSALKAARGLSVMYSRLMAVLVRVEARAKQRNRGIRRAHANYWLGRVHYVLGDPNRAIECARQSAAIAEDIDDRCLSAQAIDLMGRANWLLSEFDEAALLMERSVRQMQSLGNVTQAATSAAYAAGSRALVGDFEQAFHHLAVASELAERVEDPFVEASVCFYRGVVYAQLGKAEDAIEGFEACRRIAEPSGNLFRIYVSKFWEGWVLLRGGNKDRAYVLLEEAANLGAHLGTTFMLSWVEAIFASSYPGTRHEKALDKCDATIVRATATADRFGAALAYRARAEILAGADRSLARSAIAETARAIALQREIGTKPELARSYVVEADLLRMIGEDPKPRLAQAIELFDEMGMAVDRSYAGRLMGEQVAYSAREGENTPLKAGRSSIRPAR